MKGVRKILKFKKDQNIEVWRRMGRVTVKSFFTQTTLDKKNLEQSKEIKENWTWTENFDNYFCLIFDHYHKIFISGKRNGHWALSPPNSDTFLILPNFVWSYVLSCLETCEETRIQCFHTRYQPVHYMWWIFGNSKRWCPWL